MLLISRKIKSHEKIYVLKADDGRVRVISGSANLSHSAFNVIQRENITYMDNESTYEYYCEQFKDECADNIEHTFYCEYVCRMIDRIDNMVSQMKGYDDSYLPDIFAESSATVIEIAKELIGEDLPAYMYKCEFNDYFGNKAVGRNAFRKSAEPGNSSRTHLQYTGKKDCLNIVFPIMQTHMFCNI